MAVSIYKLVEPGWLIFSMIYIRSISKKKTAPGYGSSFFDAKKYSALVEPSSEVRNQVFV